MDARRLPRDVLPGRVLRAAESEKDETTFGLANARTSLRQEIAGNHWRPNSGLESVFRLVLWEIAAVVL
jgi:hypothetical protein